MKILYFAWVREKVGKSQEDLDLPENISTIADLISWLKTQGPEYEAAFKEDEIIRAAIDQSHATHDSSLSKANEVAFFPPVTGG